jgi:hypothetical protein
MYVNRFQTFLEVVKEGRILKKIKQLFPKYGVFYFAQVWSQDLRKLFMMVRE